ncbi:hypothetical protein RB213_012287 [Colletotrichum asianum]
MITSGLDTAGQGAARVHGTDDGLRPTFVPPTTCWPGGKGSIPTERGPRSISLLQNPRGAHTFCPHLHPLHPRFYFPIPRVPHPKPTSDRRHAPSGAQLLNLLNSVSVVEAQFVD